MRPLKSRSWIWDQRRQNGAHELEHGGGAGPAARADGARAKLEGDAAVVTLAVAGEGHGVGLGLGPPAHLGRFEEGDLCAARGEAVGGGEAREATADDGDGAGRHGWDDGVGGWKVGRGRERRAGRYLHNDFRPTALRTFHQLAHVMSTPGQLLHLLLRLQLRQLCRGRMLIAWVDRLLLALQL